MRQLVYLVLALSAAGPAAAASASAYSGQETRAIKALSAEEVEGYLAGKGAGLAKAAELNHYPGPAHVLELADALKLTPGQKAHTQAIFAAMQRDAKRHGASLIAAERELDRRFADRTITRERLRAILADIARAQADVRAAHLAAHLEQRAVLTPEQIAAYDRLRGYHADTAAGAHAHH